MDNYQEMYYKLFNKISDMIDALKTIQTETEEIFISDREEQTEHKHENRQKPGSTGPAN